MTLKQICGMINTLTKGKADKSLYIMTFNRLFCVTNHNLNVEDGFITGTSDGGDHFCIPFDKIEYITA